MGAFDKTIKDSGVYVSGEALADLTTATAVRVGASGERTVTDGPFAETREILGGFYVIDVPDLDVALDWAARCPGLAAAGPSWSGRSPTSTSEHGRAVGVATGGLMTRDGHGEVGPSIEAVFREERGLLLAALVRRFGDLDLAEEVASEAIEAALVHWPSGGVPPKPGAWLMTTARRRAVDRLRRDRAYAARLAVLQVEADRAGPAPGADADGELPDERLQLFFTCAHPALPAEDRVALTLRCLAGLTTPEVARAFLVPPATMAKRIVRAKKKIREARIPFRVPGADELPERLPGVLQVIYSIFTEGYAASSGPALLRTELAEEAIRLARILRRLLPGEREVAGLLGLMLLIHARREARVGPDGELVLLDDQDRARWDRTMIEEGQGLAVAALTGGPAGLYGVQAAIAALHDEAADVATTDWPQIVALYDVLLRLAPRRSWRSTGPRRWPCATGPRRAWPCSTSWPGSSGCAATTRTRRRGRTCCTGWAASARPRPPTARRSPRPAPSPSRRTCGAG
ncbi:DUF6596 domain-containing protein [Nonomuraea antimicrobica]